MTAVIVTAITGTGLLYLYRQTDKLIVDNRTSLGASKISAIYTEPFMVFQGQKSTEDALKKQLAKRQYGISINDPSEIGEYRFDGSVLKIYTRAFTQPNGQTRDPALVWYNFETGAISNKLDLMKHELVLEPIPIASLGSDDIRASRYKKLSELPPYLPQAFLAIEDQRFYSHMGVDPIGIFRAMVRNIIAGRFVQGGSTITQQLAKNLFFTAQKSLTRKIKEAFAALSLERHLSKEKILELYLNEVYFGRDGTVSVHGVSEAASSFLNKKVEDLTISEAALLAGMVKAPSTYALRKNLTKALERRDRVLQEMQDASYITNDQASQARTQKIIVSNINQHRPVAPHFMAQLESELSKAIDMEAAVASGISVFTGMDREFQQCAETALSDGVAALEKSHPSLKRKDVPLEASLVSIEPFSGLIKAWVGGRDFSKNQFNHVSQAARQVGSTIKPFVYLTALSPELNSYKVATPISILGDEPISIPVAAGMWQPQNYDKKFRGDVTLRYALENSLNVPAVYLSQRVGIARIADTLKRFFVADEVPLLPSLALGALDTTLLRMTAAYSALANGGRYVHPRLFSSVISRDGQLSMSVPIEEETVADEGAVYILTNILQGVVERGTARGIRTGGFSGTAAGKTGTTNDARDAWFIGFTPNLATGVWVGYDDNKKIGLTGGVAAVPIWTSYMKCIQPYLDDNSFLAPPSITTRTIDTGTYRVIDPSCPPTGAQKPEVFLKGTEPDTTCSGAEQLELPPPVDDDSYSGFDNGETPSEERSPSRRSGSIAEEYEMQQRDRSTDRGFWDSLF